MAGNVSLDNEQQGRQQDVKPVPARRILAVSTGLMFTAALIFLFPLGWEISKINLYKDFLVADYTNLPPEMKSHPWSRQEVAKGRVYNLGTLGILQSRWERLTCDKWLAPTLNPKEYDAEVIMVVYECPYVFGRPCSGNDRQWKYIGTHYQWGAKGTRNYLLDDNHSRRILRNVLLKYTADCGVPRP